MAFTETGAGKSSLLNAILDGKFFVELGVLSLTCSVDNIVPTSGMRACTAVVTEIAYHNKPVIEADVSFLTETEWKQELGMLIDDLVDEDGHLRRLTDLKSDAGVAWSKVRKRPVHLTWCSEACIGARRIPQVNSRELGQDEGGRDRRLRSE